MTLKNYVRTKSKHRAAPGGSRADAACFINDVLDGTVQATAVNIIKTPAGVYVRLQYDDPDRPGAGQGGAGTRRG
jgi:hypothetical protein